VLYVPGHSQTDICLWHEPSGSTLAADTLLQHISANAFIEPPLPGETERPRPLLQFRQSLLRLQDLPLGEIYPGHGEPYLGHVELIERRFAEQASRCEQIVDVLAGGDKTVLEISTALFPRLRGNAVFLGLSEVNGHLDLLIENGRVEEIQLEKHNLYRCI
jgi:glyoxylase-like metal-dependent hydrolase (beta-lactamase superfamily II)